ncbi:M50 family metallopeptidase [Anthocerotibacter panamensis]|uniref:M50 family metallopeptidase n=1 Tax=Anthocerotibacter panamensis TaxID=2857077 RepID=UPI001C4030CC|nr:M50 family metallopeptidase [Anthocerotibacter panamensis]
MPTVNIRPTLTPTAIFSIVGLAALLSLFLWDSPFLLPLKLITVYLHEACHALASLLTGGVPFALSVSLNESGRTLSAGGFLPVVAAAGYVGTAAIGAALIALSRNPRTQQVFVLILCGLLLLLTVTVLKIWQWEFWAGALFALSWLWFNFRAQKLALYLNLFMGCFLCVYSLHDFLDFYYAVNATDAGILASSWGLPFLALPIALSWMAINLYLMVQALRLALR